MYIAPLAGLIRSFGVQYHQYADDSQLYIAISRSNRDTQLATMEQCLCKVHYWLLHNGLSPNPAKSDAVQFTTRMDHHCEDDVESVSVSGVAITPSASVKSLGVTLDSQLSLDQHVADISKSCYFHICALRHVRDSLTDDVAKTVAVSIVTTRLGYCNSINFILWNVD